MCEAGARRVMVGVIEGSGVALGGKVDRSVSTGVDVAADPSCLVQHHDALFEPSVEDHPVEHLSQIFL